MKNINIKLTRDNYDFRFKENKIKKGAILNLSFL